MMVGYSLALAAVARVVIRWIPVSHIELYVAPFIIVMACGLMGLVFGFALIEERETGTSLLMRVIPVSRTALASYWTVVVGGSCLVICLLSALVYGVRPANMGAFLLFTAVTALGAPTVMLLLGALASNKIEGLAVSKIISGSSLMLVAVFVLPARWHLLLFWYPWYWIYRGLLEAYAGPDIAARLVVDWPALPGWIQPVVPLLGSVLGIIVLVRRYRQVT
jgi:hypothetical protein